MRLWQQAPSFRDRTRDFRDAVEISVRRGRFNNNAACGGTLDGLPSAPSEFRKRAAAVGAGIGKASGKMARFAQLAKSTSVFEDPTAEIQNLTATINDDITAFNADLQVIFNSQNERGNICQDTASHSTATVDSLKRALMNTAKEFKEVLTSRTVSLRVHQNRRKKFSLLASGDWSNPSVRHGPSVGREASESSIPPAPWAIHSASFFERQGTDDDVRYHVSHICISSS